ncbi:hypothetical protein GQ44DRAFT_446322 [Phaeosphaeriaceae sp. PMI808]|nr:hypothetical protein GQ44DRAFT_446322 [Phaeosphaeriaceae sp. PMI808]
MIVYLTIVVLIRTKTEYHAQAFSLSLGLGIPTGFLSYVVVLNCKEFPGAARAIVLETWFTTTLHVGAQYCYDNRNPMRHIMSFIMLLIVYVVLLSTFSSLPALGLLPLYTAFVSLVIWAFHESGNLVARRQQQSDVEQGQLSLQDLSPTNGASHSQSDALISSARRRNSNSSRITPPDPSVFTIGDSSDETSLRSDTPAIPHHN